MPELGTILYLFTTSEWDLALQGWVFSQQSNDFFIQHCGLLSWHLCRIELTWTLAALTCLVRARGLARGGFGGLDGGNRDDDVSGRQTLLDYDFILRSGQASHPRAEFALMNMLRSLVHIGPPDALFHIILHRFDFLHSMDRGPDLEIAYSWLSVSRRIRNWGGRDHTPQVHYLRPIEPVDPLRFISVR